MRALRGGSPSYTTIGSTSAPVGQTTVPDSVSTRAREQLGVPQWLEDGTLKLALEVELAHRAVIEDDAQTLAADHLDLADVMDVVHGARLLGE